MIPDVEPAVKLLVGNGFILAYCGFLILLFVFFFVRLYWKYRRILNDLSSARSLLRSAENEEAFFADFSRYNNTLSANRSLGHAWEEFAESLVFPGSNEPLIIRNSKEPTAHFDLASLVEPHINIRGYTAIPNYLTGLGILGTFIGLAAGIHLAEPYLANASNQGIAESAKGLQFLLKGASLAFITSIVGLSTSITFLFFERSWISKLARGIGRWNSHLDSVLEQATPEKLANEQLRELRQQTVQLKQFNTDLATSIASALDEKLAGRMGPAIERLVEGVEGLRGDRRTASEGMVESVVRQFQETMSGAVGREISAVAGTLEELNGTLESSISALTSREQEVARSMAATRENLQASLEESMGKVQAQVSTSMAEVTSRLDSSIEALGLALEQAGVGAAEHYGEALDRLTGSTMTRIESFLDRVSQSGQAMTGALESAGREAAAAVDESAERMRSQAEQSETLISSLRSACDRLSSLMEHVAESEASFRSVAPQLRDASQAFLATSQRTQESLSAIESLAHQTSESANALSETQQKLQAVWTEHVARFAETDTALGRVFAEIDSGLERFVERVTHFNSEFDQHMSSAVSLLGGAVTELGEILEEHLETMNKRRIG